MIWGNDSGFIVCFWWIGCQRVLFELNVYITWFMVRFICVSTYFIPMAPTSFECLGVFTERIVGLDTL